MKKFVYAIVFSSLLLRVSAQQDSTKPAAVDSPASVVPAVDTIVPAAAPAVTPPPAAPTASKAIIKGTVTDEKGDAPMIGVNIVVKGTTNGTRTDIDGNYSLEVTPGVITTLLYTYVGYQERQADIIGVKDAPKVVNIKMTDKSRELDIVVVSGNKVEKKLGEQTQSIEVLKGQNITNSAQGITEAMNKVPGVNMLGKTISVRGGSGFAAETSNRTLVMLDDVPLVSPENGSVRWESLPTEAIDQMEIVKGPATVSYGAQALNAMVNVRTINAHKDEPFNKIYVNSGGYMPYLDKSWTWFDSQRWTDFKNNFGKRRAAVPNAFANLAYVHARKYGDVDVLFDGALNSNAGYTAQNKNLLVRTFLKLRYIPHKLQSLSIGGNVNYYFNRYDDFFLYTNYNDTLTSTNGTPRNPTQDSLVLVPYQPAYVRVNAVNVNPYVAYHDKADGKHTLRMSYYYVQSYSTNGDSSKSNKIYTEYVYTKRFKKQDADIAAGVRYSYKKINSHTFGEKYAHYGAVYAQGEKRFGGKFTVKVGLSLEYNKLDTVAARNELTFLNTLAGRDSTSKKYSAVKPIVNVGINYQVTEGTFLRASFGQGYRFPDIAEQFVNIRRAGVVAIPNPNLKPENGWNAEVGIKQGMKFSRWVFYADLAAYLSRYNNLIEFININRSQAPDYIKTQYPRDFLFEQAKNITRAQIWGIEVSAIGTGKIFGVPLNFLLGYNYMVPRNLDYNPNVAGSQQYLYYRMRHSAKADVQTTYKGFIVGATCVYLGKVLQLDQIASLPKIADWYNAANPKGNFIVDARVGYNWKDRFTATVIAKNITDRGYVLRPGFVEAPASLTVQLTYQWGKIWPKKKVTEEEPATGS